MKPQTLLLSMVWAIASVSQAFAVSNPMSDLCRLKDADTRKQVHLIKDHLISLSKDFGRFQQRMDKLATHISQANKDVDEVQVSAKKITSRFTKIEQVELDGHDPAELTENP